MQDLIPGSRRFPGEENGNPLQYSCLGTPQTEEPGGLESMSSQWVRHDRDGECLHCMYGRASFYCVSLHCTLQTLHFLHIEGSGNTGLRKSIFSIASAHFVSLCPILVILTIFQSFSLLLYLLWRLVIRDPWCPYCNCFGAPQTTAIYNSELSFKHCMCSDFSTDGLFLHLSPSHWASLFLKTQ